MIDNEAYAWLIKTVDALIDGVNENDAGIARAVRGLITTAEATSKGESVPLQVHCDGCDLCYGPNWTDAD
jgi:hypothetical protein